MGLFGVDMPLLYGERENAFTRLQEEILRVSNDYTIFAWNEDADSSPLSLLVSSPDVLRESGMVVWTNSCDAGDCDNNQGQDRSITINNPRGPRGRLRWAARFARKM